MIEKPVDDIEMSMINWAEDLKCHTMLCREQVMKACCAKVEFGDSRVVSCPVWGRT